VISNNDCPLFAFNTDWYYWHYTLILINVGCQVCRDRGEGNGQLAVAGDDDDDNDDDDDDDGDGDDDYKNNYDNNGVDCNTARRRLLIVGSFLSGSTPLC